MFFFHWHMRFRRGFALFCVLISRLEILSSGESLTQRGSDRGVTREWGTTGMLQSVLWPRRVVHNRLWISTGSSCFQQSQRLFTQWSFFLKTSKAKTSVECKEDIQSNGWTEAIWGNMRQGSVAATEAMVVAVVAVAVAVAVVRKQTRPGRQSVQIRCISLYDRFRDNVSTCFKYVQVSSHGCVWRRNLRFWWYYAEMIARALPSLVTTKIVWDTSPMKLSKYV